MTYELALRLKNAGFPQKFRPFLAMGGKSDEVNSITYPTLEELIEACGEDFYGLFKVKIKNSVEWYATNRKRFTTFTGARAPTTMCNGKTPEIAVANLWIALQ